MSLKFVKAEYADKVPVSKDHAAACAVRDVVTAFAMSSMSIAEPTQCKDCELPMALHAFNLLTHLVLQDASTVFPSLKNDRGAVPNVAAMVADFGRHWRRLRYDMRDLLAGANTKAFAGGDDFEDDRFVVLTLDTDYVYMQGGSLDNLLRQEVPAEFEAGNVVVVLSNPDPGDHPTCVYVPGSYPRVFRGGDGNDCTVCPPDMNSQEVSRFMRDSTRKASRIQVIVRTGALERVDVGERRLLERMARESVRKRHALARFALLKETNAVWSASQQPVETGVHRMLPRPKYILYEVPSGDGESGQAARVLRHESEWDIDTPGTNEHTGFYCNVPDEPTCVHFDIEAYMQPRNAHWFEDLPEMEPIHEGATGVQRALALRILTCVEAAMSHFMAKLVDEGATRQGVRHMSTIDARVFPELDAVASFLNPRWCMSLPVREVPAIGGHKLSLHAMFPSLLLKTFGKCALLTYKFFEFLWAERETYRMLFGYNEKGAWSCIIDTDVLTPWRAMRALGCTKLGKRSPLLPIDRVSVAVLAETDDVFANLVWIGAYDVQPQFAWHSEAGENTLRTVCAYQCVELTENFHVEPTGFINMGGLRSLYAGHVLGLSRPEVWYGYVLRHKGVGSGAAGRVLSDAMLGAHHYTDAWLRFVPESIALLLAPHRLMGDRHNHDHATVQVQYRIDRCDARPSTLFEAPPDVCRRIQQLLLVPRPLSERACVSWVFPREHVRLCIDVDGLPTKYMDMDGLARNVASTFVRGGLVGASPDTFDTHPHVVFLTVLESPPKDDQPGTVYGQIIVRATTQLKKDCSVPNQRGFEVVQTSELSEVVVRRVDVLAFKAELRRALPAEEGVDLDKIIDPQTRVLRAAGADKPAGNRRLVVRKHITWTPLCAGLYGSDVPECPESTDILCAHPGAINDPVSATHTYSDDQLRALGVNVDSVSCLNTFTASGLTPPGVWTKVRLPPELCVEIGILVRDLYSIPACGATKGRAGDDEDARTKYKVATRDRCAQSNAQWTFNRAGAVAALKVYTTIKLCPWREVPHGNRTVYLILRRDKFSAHCFCLPHAKIEYNYPATVRGADRPLSAVFAGGVCAPTDRRPIHDTPAPLAAVAASPAKRKHTTAVVLGTSSAAKRVAADPK